MTLLLEWGFPVFVRATITEQSDIEVEELRRFLGALGIPGERFYSPLVVKGGRSRQGLEMGRCDLEVEPTVAADGLYPHPLKVDPTLAVIGQILPLRPSLDRLARDFDGTRTAASRRYR